MQSKSDVIDDGLINSLLQSKELKVMVKQLVQNEIKNSGSQESAIEKLTAILTTNNFYGGKMPLNPSKHSSTIPINDVRSDKSDYSEESAAQRCSLASLFRLIDTEGWAKSIYNVVSNRSCLSEDKFYLNPFGLLYHEITASSLIHIDIDGRVLDPGSTILGVNSSNWLIHRAIYKSRHDVKCIVQVSLPDVVAISSIKSGLLPISVEAVKLLDVSQKSLSGGGVKYHNPSFDRDDNYDQLISDLGQSKILFVRNYCLFVCAASIAEVWILTKTVVAACRAQVRLIQLGGKDLLKSESNFTKMNTLFSDLNFESKHSIENEIGLEAELEYEAMMRLLDNAGYRTGHKYTHRVLSYDTNHTKPSPKLESICSSEDESEIRNTLSENCPVVFEAECVNGGQSEQEVNDDGKEVESESHCEVAAEVVHDFKEDSEAYERQFVNDICTEVIDNSIQICENEELSNGGDYTD